MVQCCRSVVKKVAKLPDSFWPCLAFLTGFAVCVYSEFSEIRPGKPFWQSKCLRNKPPDPKAVLPYDIQCCIGNFLGFASGIFWFVVNVPQLIHNFRRQSVKGLSFRWACMAYSAQILNTLNIWRLGSAMPLNSRFCAATCPVLASIMLLQFVFMGGRRRGAAESSSGILPGDDELQQRRVILTDDAGDAAERSSSSQGSTNSPEAADEEGNMRFEEEQSRMDSCFRHSLSPYCAVVVSIIFSLTALLGVTLFIILPPMANGAEYRDTAISYGFYVAFVMWSYEDIPQLVKNHARGNCDAQSKLRLCIAFALKTMDSMYETLLNVPLQYQFLSYFSTLTTYINCAQFCYLERRRMLRRMRRTGGGGTGRAPLLLAEAPQDVSLRQGGDDMAAINSAPNEDPRTAVTATGFTSNHDRETIDRKDEVIWLTTPKRLFSCQWMVISLATFFTLALPVKMFVTHAYFASVASSFHNRHPVLILAMAVGCAPLIFYLLWATHLLTRGGTKKDQPDEPDATSEGKVSAL